MRTNNGKYFVRMSEPYIWYDFGGTEREYRNIKQVVRRVAAREELPGDNLQYR